MQYLYFIIISSSIFLVSCASSYRQVNRNIINANLIDKSKIEGIHIGSAYSEVKDVLKSHGAEAYFVDVGEERYRCRVYYASPEITGIGNDTEGQIPIIEKEVIPFIIIFKDEIQLIESKVIYMDYLQELFNSEENFLLEQLKPEIIKRHNQYKSDLFFNNAIIPAIMMVPLLSIPILLIIILT